MSRNFPLLEGSKRAIKIYVNTIILWVFHIPLTPGGLHSFTTTFKLGLCWLMLLPLRELCCDCVSLVRREKNSHSKNITTISSGINFSTFCNVNERESILHKIWIFIFFHIHEIFLFSTVAIFLQRVKILRKTIEILFKFVWFASSGKIGKSPF